MKPVPRGLCRSDSGEIIEDRNLAAERNRVSCFEIVKYEFLLPAVHCGRTRDTLDALFYTDTIKQRLKEVGWAQYHHWIKQEDGETEEEYLERLCALISEKFGGYSISHVSGRYRAAALASREDAARMLVNDERYLVDETTASVRFLIPIQSTRTPQQSGLNMVDLHEATPPPDSAVTEEISLVHSLFFNLFVEAVVRTIQGEDEIWLVEEAGRSRSLYVWERS